MKDYILPIIIYLASMSLASIVLTVKDKNAAKKHQWRIPESVLMFFGLFGGATAMLITMKKIRHKTKHIKFMVGLPLEIILHIAILIWLFLTIGF